MKRTDVVAFPVSSRIQLSPIPPPPTRRWRRRRSLEATMSSCSLSPAARLEFQRRNRSILPDSGGKELSRSSKIVPRRNSKPLVARASLTISSSNSAAPIERIETRRNPCVARSSDSPLSISSATSASPIERIEPRRNTCVARSSDSSMSISSSTSAAPIESKTALLHLTSFPDRECDRDPITAENLDVWIRDSIGEIVRHIGEAPFLLRIYSPAAASASGGGARIEREAAATAERWPRIRERWDREGRTPDGVILVEELRDEEADGGGGEKTWGLVVQGKGMDYAACYVLNTCRVRSSGGFCTHFCLVRAKCFGEAPEVQLRKAWVAGKELGI